MNPLPAPAPLIDADTAEFWAATVEGRLLLRRCDSCGQAMWYPRSICPSCHSAATSWVEASGRGQIYSYTVTTRGMDEFSSVGAYVVAYVELDEGPRVLTNIVDCDPETLEIGQPVDVVFADTGQGAALPRFRPTSAHDSGGRQ
jgi:uncharacterized OB-fold protein